MERTPVLSMLGAVGAAVASALCCIGPLLYVSLGVGADPASDGERGVSGPSAGRASVPDSRRTAPLAGLAAGLLVEPGA